MYEPYYYRYIGWQNHNIIKLKQAPKRKRKKKKKELIVQSSTEEEIDEEKEEGTIEVYSE